MIHYKLRNVGQFDGGFTDLFIIGVNKVPPAVGSTVFTSDFTAAATTQDIQLTAIAARDVVLPNVLVDVIVPVTGGTLSAVTISIGRNSAPTEFINAASVFTSLTHADDGGVAGVATASDPLEARIGTVGDNVADATAGEIWIWATISRFADRYTLRSA